MIIELWRIIDFERSTYKSANLCQFGFGRIKNDWKYIVAVLLKAFFSQLSVLVNPCTILYVLGLYTDYPLYLA